MNHNKIYWTLSPLFFVVLLCAACHKELPEGNPSDTNADSIQDNTLAFSVSPVKKVYFSPGNLEVQGRMFVKNEWEYGGYFAWGTGEEPNNTSMDNSDYQTFHDWGDYLFYAEAGWRTLNMSEWGYVLVYRKDAELKKGTGTLNGIHGMILLPDRWSAPEGIVFSPGCVSWGDNVFNREQWERMKEGGAVFLPAADYVWNMMPPHLGASGLYWTSTPKGDTEAYYMCFYDGRVYPSVTNQRCYRQSVRLVRDVD